MKKSVKLVLLSAIGALSVLSTVSSCKRDKCKTVSCQNTGVCDDGACKCAPGYEGSQCEVASKDKYTGSWFVDETGPSSGRQEYQVAIENSLIPGANAAEVQITNMNNTINGRVTGRLVGDTIYIPQQTIDGKTIEGKGTLLSDDVYGVHKRLTMRYKIIFNNTKEESDYGFVVGTPSEWHK